jgi:hypothetical protein
MYHYNINPSSEKKIKSLAYIDTERLIRRTKQEFNTISTRLSKLMPKHEHQKTLLVKQANNLNIQER